MKRLKNLSFLLFCFFFHLSGALGQEVSVLKNSLDSLKNSTSYIELLQLKEIKSSEEYLEHLVFKKKSYLANQAIAQYYLISELQQQFYLETHQYRASVLFQDSVPLDIKGDVLKYILSNVWFHNGVAYHKMNEIDSSIYWHKRALSLRELIQTNEIGDLAKSHSYLGYLYRYKKNEPAGAEKHYKSQLSWLLKTKENSPSLAQCYYNLSATYGLKQDYDLSLTYAFKALDLGVELQMPDYFKSYCITSIANNYKLMRKFKQALQYYQKSIQFSLIGLGPSHPSLILQYNNTGVTYQGLKNLDSARFYFKKALDLALVHYGSEAKEVANCYMLLSLSDLHLPQGKVWINKALSIYQSSNQVNSENLPLAQIRLGKWFQNFNQFDSAFFYFNKALSSTSPYISDYFPNFSSVLNRPYELIAIRNRAQLLTQLCNQHPDSLELHIRAFDHYTFIDHCSIKQKKSLSRENSKLQLADRYKEDYENALQIGYHLINHFQEKKYLGAYWGILEKNKASILLESINTIQARYELDLPNKIRQLEKKLEGEYSNLKGLLAIADYAKIPSIQQELLVLENTQDSLIKVLQQSYPRYYESKYQVNTIELKDIKQYTRNNNLAFLQYFMGKENLYAISVYSNTVKTIQIPLDPVQQELKILLEQLHQGFNYKNRKEDFIVFKQAGTQLYRLLVDTLLDSEWPKKILIAPDGNLSSLPFEVLLNKAYTAEVIDYSKLPYWLFTKDISYCFSASIQLKTSSSSLDFSSLRAFQAQAGTSLSGTSQEIENMMDVFPNTHHLEGEECTKAEFKAVCGNTEILHFALHNVNDLNNPYNSGILFNGADSLLRVHELYNLNLQHTKLAVLSACETGLGEYYTGEGVYSIGRGFQYAGVPSIITSLWKVPDATAPAIMGHFYQNLNEKQSSSKALNLAQQNFILTNDHFGAHPSNWAAFVHFGEIQKSNPPYPYYLIFGLSLLVILVIILFISKRTNSHI